MFYTFLMYLAAGVRHSVVIDPQHANRSRRPGALAVRANGVGSRIVLEDSDRSPEHRGDGRKSIVVDTTQVEYGLLPHMIDVLAALNAQPRGGRSARTRLHVRGARRVAGVP